MKANKDPRVNWELGWKAIRNEVMKIGKERDELVRARAQSEDELYDLRLEASLDREFKYFCRLKELEIEVRRREMNKAHLWRLRSKST